MNDESVHVKSLLNIRFPCPSVSPCKQSLQDIYYYSTLGGVSGSACEFKKHVEEREGEEANQINYNVFQCRK